MEHKECSANPAHYVEHKKWSTNQAHYMEHKVIHKSSPLCRTQEVIHKSSPLHGTQSDPQIQPVTWNTKWSINPAHYMEHKQWYTNPACYMERKVIYKSSPLHGTQSAPQIQSITLRTKWSTNPVCHMEHSDPQIQPVTWNTKRSTNPVCYMERKCSNHIFGQWQWCTNIFFIPSGAIHRYQGILTPPPFPLVCPAPCPRQSNPYINVFFSCSWYMHPVAGSTLLKKHVLIFTIPQKVTLQKTSFKYPSPQDKKGKLTMLTIMTQEYNKHIIRFFTFSPCMLSHSLY
jgi:hypothetical protein